MRIFLNGNTRLINLPALLISVLICLISCAGGPEAVKPAAKKQFYAFLSDRAKYILLPPSEIEKPLDMPQLVSASYGGRDYYLNTWVKADETGIDMILFSELGANMGELSYRENAVSFSSPVFPQSLKPEYIVADFQLCFYNAAALERALFDAGLVLEIAGTSRRIFNGKNLVMEIEKKPDAVKLVNYLRGYSYTLEGDFE